MPCLTRGPWYPHGITLSPERVGCLADEPAAHGLERASITRKEHKETPRDARATAEIAPASTDG